MDLSDLAKQARDYGFLVKEKSPSELWIKTSHGNLPRIEGQLARDRRAFVLAADIVFGDQVQLDFQEADREASSRAMKDLISWLCLFGVDFELDALDDVPSRVRVASRWAPSSGGEGLYQALSMLVRAARGCVARIEYLRAHVQTKGSC